MILIFASTKSSAFDNSWNFLFYFSYTSAVLIAQPLCIFHFTLPLLLLNDTIWYTFIQLRLLFYSVSCF